jgi:uncharacterized membrane protein YphA (DoxX/SURF4 family)
MDDGTLAYRLGDPVGWSDMTIASSRDNPAWVHALLARPWVMPLVRLALVSAYLVGGIDKALHFDDARAEQAHFGLHPAALWAVLAIAVEIFGSLCVICRRFTWLGAGGLGVLTVVAMLVANDFWDHTGAARFMALNSFFEHLGLIAALVLATVLSDPRSEGNNRRQGRAVSELSKESGARAMQADGRDAAIAQWPVEAAPRSKSAAK